MRPNQRRSTRRAKALARGRMYLKARLSWLPGFPVAQGQGCVDWIGAPAQGVLTLRPFSLTRQHLHDATYTWGKLAHHFPRVLPRLVADRDRWVQGTPQLLAWLKAAIHTGEPLPASLLTIDGAFSESAVAQANGLAQRHPALLPLLNALTWIHYLTPNDLPAALAWLAGRAERIQNLLQRNEGQAGLFTAVLLWRLAQQAGESRVDPLLRFVGDDRAFALAISGATHYSSAWQTRLAQAQPNDAEPALSQPELGPMVLGFVHWLAIQDRGTRRRALDLFALLLPDNLLDQWQEWWTQADKLRRTAQQLPAMRRATATTTKLQRAWKQLQVRTPPQIHINILLADVERVAAPVYSDLFRALSLILPLLPQVQDNRLVRATLFHEWSILINAYRQRLPALLHEYHNFIKAHGVGVLLHTPWLTLADVWSDWQITLYDALSETLLDEPDRRLWPVTLATILACTQQGRLESFDVDRIVMLARLTGDAQQATAYFSTLDEAGLRGDYLPERLLRCAITLDGRRGRFRELVLALNPVNREDEQAVNFLLLAETHFHAAGWVGLGRALVCGGEWLRVHQVGVLLAALAALGEPVVPPRPPQALEAPLWNQRYPEELTPTLALLDAISPQAQQLAARILDKDFPNPEKLRQEIAAIEARLAQRTDAPHLRQRHTNLQARLSAPDEVSPERLKNLAEKLERTMQRAVVDHWQATLQLPLRTRISALLSVAEPPVWLFQPRQLTILNALWRLEPRMRALGIRLLRLRCGPPPWNLATDPANAAFLAGLERQGIDPTPWLHPPPPRCCTGSNGRMVYLNFEADPLEIFQMGAHFNTCLSPGEVNFFSVFANAADINKQVVYAHDERGQVVGRCLLALTNEGRLLTFAPYCHDPGLGFAQLIAEWADELATQMGTLVVGRGNVSCLVAPDWYDDGPHDLCNRFQFLQPNSTFRSNLATLDLADLTPALEAAFAPLPLNALTLPLVLDLPEWDQRPELVIPLLPSLEKCATLPDSLWLRIADLAHRAGATQFARQVWRQHGAPYFLKLRRRYVYHHSILLRGLAELEPSLALRVLRRTRVQGVRRDEDETDSVRRELLATAHARLGRTQRAERLRAPLTANSVAPQ